jgi:hypothetical protein
VLGVEDRVDPGDHSVPLSSNYARFARSARDDFR